MIGLGCGRISVFGGVDVVFMFSVLISSKDSVELVQVGDVRRDFAAADHTH